MIPLILTPDESLKDDEEFIGIKTISISDEGGNMILGYVGIARNINKTLDWRMITLKAEKYKVMSDTVI